MTEHKKYFELYPEVEEFFFTSDGQAFFTEHEAWNHSINIGDKEVIPVTREEATSPDLSKGEEKENVDNVDTASTGSATDISTSNSDQEEVDTTTVVEAEEKLKGLDLETDSPDYMTMKKLVKELQLDVADQKASTLLDALTAKKSALSA